MRTTFRPIGPDWPGQLRPDHERRSRWTFRASWADTLEKIVYEADRLDADQLTFRLALDESGLTKDGSRPRSGARPDPPTLPLFELES